MNGNKLRLLIKRLMDGDIDAQDLAYKLDRASTLEAMTLLEANAVLVDRYMPSDQPPSDEGQPGLFA